MARRPGHWQLTTEFPAAGPGGLGPGGETEQGAEVQEGSTRLPSPNTGAEAKPFVGASRA